MDPVVQRDTFDLSSLLKGLAVLMGEGEGVCFTIPEEFDLEIEDHLWGGRKFFPGKTSACLRRRVVN